MLYSTENIASGPNLLFLSISNFYSPVKIMLAGIHWGIYIVNGIVNIPISGYPSTQFEIGNEVLMIYLVPS